MAFGPVVCPLCRKRAIVRESKDYKPALVAMGYPKSRFYRGWYCATGKGGCGETFNLDEDRIWRQVPEHVQQSILLARAEHREAMYAQEAEPEGPTPTVPVPADPDPEAVELLERVLFRVEAAVNRHTFATWFRPLRAIDLSEKALRVSAPNDQFVDWLTKNYSGNVRTAMEAEGVAHVEFVVLDERTLDRAPP